MRNNLIIKPTTLSIITTYTCTSTCNDCCFQCNPKRTERLTCEEIKQYIADSIKCYNTIKVLVLTGGECFLYAKELDGIIKYAKSFNLITRVVTNGFWAKSYEKAYKRIEALSAAGLDEINFSTGDDHLKYVPIEFIKNGALAAVRQKLTTVINVESNEEKKFNSKQLLGDEDLLDYIVSGDLKIINGLWMPFKKDTNSRLENLRKEGKCTTTPKRCTNIFNTITIDPNRRMIACCGLTSKYVRALDLGNVSKYKIDELYNNQFNDFLKIWIATEGPHKIMDFLSKFTVLPEGYEKLHACQICASIFNTPSYLSIIKDQYESIYSGIILKYLFIKKQLN